MAFGSVSDASSYEKRSDSHKMTTHQHSTPCGPQTSLWLPHPYDSQAASLFFYM
jgi:hypothetical protein